MVFQRGKGILLLLGFVIGIHHSISAQSTLFARTSGNWSNADPTNGTWSIVGIGGAACACTPSAIDSVVVGTYTVTVDVDGDCKSLTVLGNGTLSINNNRGVDINNSGAVWVLTDGTVSHSGLGSNAHIDFEAGGNSLLTLDSACAFSLDDLYVENADTLEVAGKGDLTLTDDFFLNGTNCFVTNNLEGEMKLIGTDNSSVWFRPAASNCTFINNGKLTVDRYLYFESTGHHFINNDTVILSRSSRGISLIGNTADNTVFDNYGYFLVEGEFQANTSTVTFNNYAFLDINGDFRGFNGPGYLYNFANATIRWAGDYDNNALRLYCNYPSSTFIYDGSSAQPDLFDPQDNYVNLVFENTGSKRYHNSFIVKGNMIVDAPLVVESGLRYLYFDSAATLLINHGGSLTQTGGVARLQLTSNHDYDLTIHDTVNGFGWQRLIVDTNVNVTLNGNGKFSLPTPSAINFTGSNSSLLNNLTDTIVVTGITFLSGSSNSSFLNNGPIISAADLIFNGSHDTFTNNSYYQLDDDLIFVGIGNTFYGNTGSSLLIADEVQLYADSSTLRTGSLLTIGDQLLFNARNCSLLVNGITNVASTFRVINATMDNNTAIIESTGALTINSFMQLDDADFVLKNSGTLTVIGAFDDFGGEDSIINMAGGTINYAGSHFSIINNELGLYCDYAGSTFNYNRSDGVAQDIIPPRDAYHHLSLSGSGTKTALGDLQMKGNVSITGTATFDITSNTADLEVGGGWENSGSFNVGTQTVTFNGTTSASFSGTSKTPFYDLIIDRETAGSALTFTAQAEVQNSLTLTNGVLNTTANSEIILLDDISCSEGNDSSFVSGPVMKIGDDPFVYPLGSGDLWARLELFDLINSPSVTDTFIASFTRGRHAESFWDSLDYAGSPGGMKNVSIVEFWDLERRSGTTQPKITLHWENGDSSYITNLSDLTIAHYLGGNSWKAEPASTSGTVAAGTITTANNMDTFSPFTFGSFSKNANPLPIELLSFYGYQLDNSVSLEWVTESEINNDYFELERSQNGRNFERIARIGGHGNSSHTIRYSQEDSQPLNGYNYYRLKQVDYDGAYSYSDLIAVKFTAEFDVLLYPNPSSGSLFLQFGSSFNSENVQLSLWNLEGLELQRWELQNEQQELQLRTFSPGTYLLKIEDSQQVLLKKLTLINN
jgi:hypothetical protein